MATEWIDISTSAFYGDYNAYIRYANQLLNISGTATDASTNGMRVFNVSPNTTYRVTMAMRNRFRVACVSNLTSSQTLTNYVFDPLDTNDTADQSGAERSLEITAGSSDEYLLVGAWASGASETIFNTLNSIVLAEQKTTFTVVFSDYDGTVLKTETVTAGTSATPPENPTREGYIFTGWSGDYSNVTSDLTLTAQYVDASNLTVTFVDFDGTVLSTQTVEYGSDAVPPAIPTRDGYVFDHWNGSYTNITESTTVTAVYVPDESTLTSIEITALPTKTAYKQGESFDGAGLVVSGIYTIAGTVPISDYTLSGFDTDALGTCTVTVSNGGYSASFEIAVSENIVTEECGLQPLSSVVATLNVYT